MPRSPFLAVLLATFSLAATQIACESPAAPPPAPALAADAPQAAPVEDPSPEVPAFPGAGGFGRWARGGRGGRVLYVTHLGDSGPGSLRAAIEASGPRTVLFATGGTITLDSPLLVTEPYLTIAGQSAPGGGIALRNGGRVTSALLAVETHDVVIRHLRSRPGPDRDPNGSCCLDALQVRGDDVIVDHVSLSWSVDETASIGGDSRGVTVQWSILAESLGCSNHRETLHGIQPERRGGAGAHLQRGLQRGPEGRLPRDRTRQRPATEQGRRPEASREDPERSRRTCPGRPGPPHNFGMSITNFPDEAHPQGSVSLHHNLWAHHQGRHPNITSHTVVDVVNNVFYDFEGALSKLGPKSPGWQVRANFVGNFYAAGPQTPPVTRLFTFPVLPGERDPLRVHVAGNVLAPGLEDPSGRSSFAAAAPIATGPVATTDAATAFEEVLDGAGATLPARDAVDARIVEDVRRRGGGPVDDPSEVGGWPELAPGTPPLDADQDGMPDRWEGDHGLDPGMPADGAADADGDGYSNLEEYLNGTEPAFAEGDPGSAAPRPRRR